MHLPNPPPYHDNTDHTNTYRHEAFQMLPKKPGTDGQELPRVPVTKYMSSKAAGKKSRVGVRQELQELKDEEEQKAWDDLEAAGKKAQKPGNPAVRCSSCILLTSM